MNIRDVHMSIKKVSSDFLSSVEQYISRSTIQDYFLFLTIVATTVFHAALLYRVLYLNGGSPYINPRVVIRADAWPKVFLLVSLLSNAIASLLMQPWQLGCTKKNNQLSFELAYESQLRQSLKIIIDMVFIFVFLCMPQVRLPSPWIIASSWVLSMKNIIPVEISVPLNQKQHSVVGAMSPFHNPRAI